MAVKELTEADNGTDVRLASGEEVMVRLPENRSTSYRWRVARHGDNVVVVEDRFVAGADSPGAWGSRELRVRADSPGVGSLELVTVDQYNESSPPRDIFSVDLVVD